MDQHIQPGLVNNLVAEFRNGRSEEVSKGTGPTRAYGKWEGFLEHQLDGRSVLGTVSARWRALVEGVELQQDSGSQLL